MNEVAYIYAIENVQNGKMYIGSTKNYTSRWHTHKSTLRKGKHHSFILQKAWNKYGEDKFIFKLLLICSKENRYFYEQNLMSLQSYNVFRTVRECKVRGGWKHTDEFKTKISKLHKGKALTDDHKKKLSATALGRVYGDEFKHKARNRQLGVSPSEKTRQKLSSAIKNHYKDQTLEKENLVRKIYNEYGYGDNISQLLIKYDCSAGTFYAYCNSMKLKPVKQKAIDDMITSIKKYEATGLTITEACIKMQLNAKSVKSLMAKKGYI